MLLILRFYICQMIAFNIFKWICAFVSIDVNVDVLDSVLKRFKDSSEIAMKNIVPTVLRIPRIRGSHE